MYTCVYVYIESLHKSVSPCIRTKSHDLCSEKVLGTLYLSSVQRRILTNPSDVNTVGRLFTPCTTMVGHISCVSGLALARINAHLLH